MASRGRPKGTKLFKIDGKRTLVYPEEKDGQVRWIGRFGEDLTDKILQAQFEKEPAPGQEAGKGGQGPVPEAPESPRAAPPAAPAAVQAPPTYREEEKAPVTFGDPFNVEKELQIANSAIITARDTLKAVEIQLKAINRALHETDIQRHMAAQAERDRLGIPSSKEHIKGERAVIRKETEKGP